MKVVTKTLLVVTALWSSFCSANQPNQTALINSLRQCDASMSSMLIQRGGVSMEQDDVLNAALQGVFDGAKDDPKMVQSCIEGLKLIFRNGAKANVTYTRASGDAFDILTFFVGRSGSGHPPMDERRLKSPINWAKRGMEVLSVLSENGYDFRTPIRSIYKGPVSKYSPAPNLEDANLLMKLSAAESFQQAAAPFVSKENPHVVSIYFFNEVLAATDVNAANSRGKTALMFAAASQNRSAAPIIKILLGSGANKYIKDKSGKTALDYALENGDNEAAKLLM